MVGFPLMTDSDVRLSVGTGFCYGSLSFLFGYYYSRFDFDKYINCSLMYCCNSSGLKSLT